VKVIERHYRLIILQGEFQNKEVTDENIAKRKENLV
jgi:hypothetical protein